MYGSSLWYVSSVIITHPLGMLLLHTYIQPILYCWVINKIEDDSFEGSDKDNECNYFVGLSEDHERLQFL